jgi:hypothetical protein
MVFTSLHLSAADPGNFERPGPGNTGIEKVVEDLTVYTGDSTFNGQNGLHFIDTLFTSKVVLEDCLSATFTNCLFSGSPPTAKTCYNSDQTKSWPCCNATSYRVDLKGDTSAVEFDKCTFRNTDSAAVLHSGGNSGVRFTSEPALTFKQCDIGGGGVYDGNYEEVEVGKANRHCGDGIKSNVHTLMERCWIHSLGYTSVYPSSHSDGVQVQKVRGDFTVDRCYFELPSVRVWDGVDSTGEDVCSCFKQYDAKGHRAFLVTHNNTDVGATGITWTIKDSWFNSPQYSIGIHNQCGEGTDPPTTVEATITVSGCKFTRNFRAGLWSASDKNGSETVLTTTYVNNSWEELDGSLTPIDDGSLSVVKEEDNILNCFESGECTEDYEFTYPCYDAWGNELCDGPL